MTTAKTKKKSPKLPTSDATNAYDLLTDVCRVVREEPKRLHMNYVLIQKDEDTMVAPKGYPSCGAVGCIDGWSRILTGSVRTNGTCGPLLGLTATQYYELCYPPALLAESGDSECDGLGQTREHAEHVIAHIHAFQKKYAAQLKAKAV